MLRRRIEEVKMNDRIRHLSEYFLFELWRMMEMKWYLFLGVLYLFFSARVCFFVDF